MATTGEQPHFSSRVLDVAEKAQRVFGRTSVGRWVTGSDAPAYLRLEWFRLDVDPGSLHWAREVEGDPEAGRLPRNWNNAAILGVGKDDLAGMSAHEPGAGQWAKDAVAFESDGVVRVGINPEGDRIFGGTTQTGQEGMLTVAMRLGRGPLRATMGHFQPGSGEFFTPSGIVVLEEHIPNEAITAPDYPHTRLAG